MDDQISAPDPDQGSVRRSAFRALVVDYLELTKARLGALVVLTTFVGYVLGVRGHLSPSTLAATVIGTALSSFGANILNQWLEVERDRLMVRTRSRPLPAHRMEPRTALVLGLVTALVGLVVLAGSIW